MSNVFELRSAGCRRGVRDALLDVSVELKGGEFICLCGLNGAGKSTLLEVMAGLLRNYTGLCRLEGRDVREWSPRALARRVSYLPQTMQSLPPIPVTQVVMMGRNPFRDRWRFSPEDHSICEQAMATASCADLRGRMFDQLSGGERQRVLFAATLAQQPVALLLDEPGTFIDLPHQIQMFRTIRDLAKKGLLCVAATHDLNLAASYATRILLLDRGRLLLDGPPTTVFTSPIVGEVFGSDICFAQSEDGRPRLHYAE